MTGKQTTHAPTHPQPLLPSPPTLLLLAASILATSFLAASILAASPSPALAAPGASPWEILEEVRRDLIAAGPTAASFVHDYLPAGFSSGETETGRLSLEIPDCLRWDYEPPAEKSFLLCGSHVHAWTSDDPVGQRYEVQPEREPGLDLLLLPTEDLRLRYSAESHERDGGEVEIHLTPATATASLRDATLVVDRTIRRLLRIEYRDGEGNLTRFRISNYGKLEGREVFVPPEDIEWQIP